MNLEIDFFKYLAYAFILITSFLQMSLYARVGFILAGLAALVFTISQTLWIEAAILGLIIATHTIYIGVYLYKKKALTFSSEQEQLLYDISFPHFSISNFKKIVSIGEFVNADTGDILTELGKPVLHLIIMCKGKARVVVNGQTIAYSHPGNLIGEMSFITHAPASATVYIVEPSTYIQWPQDKLRELLDSDEELRSAMQTIFNEDFARKHMPHTEDIKDSEA